MSAKRALAIWTALGIAALAVFVASLALGSVSVAPSRVLDALLPSADVSSDLATQIVRTLRLPRALAGFGCGALLALAGALLQVLLRNPLAEPYVLGVSGGAASFALVAMIAGCAPAAQSRGGGDDDRAVAELGAIPRLPSTAVCAGGRWG